jgi:hypothetical protein
MHRRCSINGIIFFLAMKRGYSKILINHDAIPDEGAHSISTAVDIFMPATFASRERTEADWTN